MSKYRKTSTEPLKQLRRTLVKNHWATTKARVGSRFRRIFCKGGSASRLCIVTALFAIVMDVMTEGTRNNVLHEILFADDRF